MYSRCVQAALGRSGKSKLASSSSFSPRRKRPTRGLEICYRPSCVFRLINSIFGGAFPRSLVPRAFIRISGSVAPTRLYSARGVNTSYFRRSKRFVAPECVYRARPVPRPRKGRKNSACKTGRTYFSPNAAKSRSLVPAAPSVARARDGAVHKFSRRRRYTPVGRK